MGHQQALLFLIGVLLISFYPLCDCGACLRYDPFGNCLTTQVSPLGALLGISNVPSPRVPQVATYPAAVPAYPAAVPAYPAAIPAYPAAVPAYPAAMPAYPVAMPAYGYNYYG
ncbi:uncharacterized protein LOC117564749 [Drosophila albomicans]|uniref:Uncharacterized protein LOC117564749 n=1 Tax=Drosophila albomicans TaxID=7291 RepID=A0A6P8WNJ7_DROAB|nr:uncharacterized protein LOC117564749 [Drosophila albomicans]